MVERREGEGGERQGETGGHTLSSALMTFGKQRAPSALEETECICYRAQASNLILDRCNEIDTIYEAPNSLICYRNPQRTFSFQTSFFHYELMLQRKKKKKPFSNLYTVIKLNVELMLQHKSKVNYHFVYCLWMAACVYVCVCAGRSAEQLHWRLMCSQRCCLWPRISDGIV